MHALEDCMRYLGAFFPVSAAPGQTVYPPNPRRFSLVAHLPSVFLRKSYTTEKSLLAKPFAISVR